MPLILLLIDSEANIHMLWIHPFKGALTGLKQLFATESSLKMMSEGKFFSIFLSVALETYLLKKSFLLI